MEKRKGIGSGNLEQLTDEKFEGRFMMERNSSARPSLKVLFGFLAGFFATLIFHQLTLLLMWAMEVAPFGPYSMVPTKPFGIPAVFSLAFWGGIWGVLFALIHDRIPRGGYWVITFLFGAILPSLVALLVVLPLKGRPLAGGGHPALLLTAFLINGFWGIGTGLILKMLSSWSSRATKG